MMRAYIKTRIKPNWEGRKGVNNNGSVCNTPNKNNGIVYLKKKIKRRER